MTALIPRCQAPTLSRSPDLGTVLKRNILGGMLSSGTPPHYIPTATPNPGIQVRIPAGLSLLLITSIIVTVASLTPWRGRGGDPLTTPQSLRQQSTFLRSPPNCPSYIHRVLPFELINFLVRGPSPHIHRQCDDHD